MIKVLNKNFAELGVLTNITTGTVTKADSGSWQINLEVIKDNGLTNYLKRENYLLYNGQKFTIREAVVERSGEEKYVRVSAEHVFHELDEHVVTEEYQLTGTIADHVDALLAHQEGSDFAYEAGGTGTMYEITRTITIPAGSLASGLKKILEHFYARLVLDNYKVKPIPRTKVFPSSVVMEYGVQNNNVSRTYSRDGVVTKIYGKATIDGQEVTKEYTAANINDYRNPITESLDFGALESVEDMDWLAAEHLFVYSSPDATYELDYAELKLISNIGDLYPGRDFALDTGMGVRVLDTDLGIDVTVPVKTYSYSLTHPELPSRITLGNFRQLRIMDEKATRAENLSEETTAIQWAETVMDYVKQVLGGTIRDIDPGLLVFTPLAGTRKTLSGVVNTLQNMHPDYSGTKYNNPFTVKDPLAEIKRRKIRSINLAYGVIDRYITDTVGAGSLIVTRINQAYANKYGPGTSAPYPADDGASVFGGDYDFGTQEFSYASSIVNRLNNTIGNTSAIYLELGGGSNGAIGAINDLYTKLTQHSITVSSLPPDDSVGKDGDLWFQVESEDVNEE